MTTAKIKLIPDGTGRVCIHYFHKEANGHVRTPSALMPSTIGLLRVGGEAGRIACDASLRTVTPQTRGNELQVCPHTDDPRAATCPACLKTPLWREAMLEIGAELPPGEPAPDTPGG
jgi:hypothetical protein